MHQPKILAHFVISADGKILTGWPLSPRAEALQAELRSRADATLEVGEIGSPADADRLRQEIARLSPPGKKRTLLCASSPASIFALLELDLLDEIFLTIAPSINRDPEAPTVTGKPGRMLPASREFRLKEMVVEAGECHTHHIRRRRRSV